MSPNLTYNEKELSLLIASGDGRAFGYFYRQTSAGVYNAAIAYVRDPHLAREIVQVTYIKIWDKRDRLPEVQQLKDYLFIVARNTILDHFRMSAGESRRREMRQMPTVEYADTVTPVVQEREYRHLLHKVVSRLPDRQREVYLLASEQDMSYEEIAANLRVSRLTVKRHLELARRFVRKYFHHHLDGQALMPIVVLLSSLFR